MLNFNNQSGTLSAEKSGGAIQQSAGFLKRLLLVTLFCALSFMLSAPSLVQAEDLQEGTPAEQPSTKVQPVNTADPAGLIASAVPENQAPAKANAQADDGLEIGPELIGQPVGAGIEAPTITKAFIGTNTISGGSLHRGRINNRPARGTVHVTLKDSSGGEKATVSVTPRSGTTWTVTLPEGVTIAEGDTVTAYQEFDGQNSPVTTANAMDSLAIKNKDKLKMPTGEIWIEQTSSNIVNADEQEEAVKMFNNANTAIAGDIKSVKFSINTADHAYYEVTYTDGSTSGKIEAPNLKIKQVAEYSRGATLGSITIVDNVIKGQLAGEGPFDGIKVQILLKLSDAVKDSYCDGGKCLVDKDTSNPVDATVNGETGEFTYTIPNPDLKLDQKVGVTVKEPHKFKSCSQTPVKPVIVEKTEVRDPRKLTAKNKKAIDAAIRKAYTVNGTSKLPNGVGGWDGVPAVIQIDDSGNVKIFSGNDVAGTWDPNNNYKFVPEKNEDGSYKLNDGAQPKITYPAKDLLKNIAPKSPAIKVDTDTGKVTITPPAYKDPGDDTDLASYTITYKDASDADKTVTLTRTVDATGKTTWTSDGATVDAATGVVTLQIKDLAVGATITAKAKDKGGLEGDTEELESAPASEPLETVEVTYNAGDGGKGTMTDGKLKDGKKLNKGLKYKVLASTFTAPENQEFDTWEIDGNKVAADTEITVTKDTVIKATWKKIPVTVTYDGNGGKGTMKEDKTLYKGDTYKVLASTFTAPENQEFDYWEIDGEKVAANTEITLTKDTVVKAIWKDKPVPSSTTPGNQKPGDNNAKPQKQHPTAAGNLSKTGANGMYSLYSSMIMLAAGSLFVISRRRRSQR